MIIEFVIKHICGMTILFIISLTTYFLYCGIGHIALKIHSRRTGNDRREI